MSPRLTEPISHFDAGLVSLKLDWEQTKAREGLVNFQIILAEVVPALMTVLCCQKPPWVLSVEIELS